MRDPRFTRMLGAAVALSIGGCLGLDPTGGDPTGEDPELGQDTAALERIGVTITEDNNVPAERCQVGVDASGDRAWPAGRQLLLYRGVALRGMCTVDAATHGSGLTTILASRDVMVERIWESADGGPPPALAAAARILDHHRADALSVVRGRPLPGARAAGPRGGQRRHARRDRDR